MTTVRKEHVLYSILFRDCERVHVGKIGRTFKIQIAEHKQVVWRFDKKKLSCPQGATSHRLEQGLYHGLSDKQGCYQDQ